MKKILLTSRHYRLGDRNIFLPGKMNIHTCIVLKKTINQLPLLAPSKAGHYVRDPAGADWLPACVTPVRPVIRAGSQAGNPAIR